MSAQVVDPDLGAQAYTVQRSTHGTFVLDGYTDTKSYIANFGVIQDSTPEDVSMVPPGDQVHGMLTFWSVMELFKTNLDGVSDIILWHGDNYRIMHVADRSDFGFWKAIATRMTGA